MTEYRIVRRDTRDNANGRAYTLYYVEYLSKSWIWGNRWKRYTYTVELGMGFNKSYSHEFSALEEAQDYMQNLRIPLKEGVIIQTDEAR